MDTLPITGNLTMLRVNGWQVYVWRDGGSVTLIDTGAPGSGADILSALPGVDRIVLTHGHVDHSGSAAELRASTAAPVLAGAGDAAVIRGDAQMAPARFAGWPRSTSRQPASAMASRSRRAPVTGFARWLPH